MVGNNGIRPPVEPPSFFFTTTGLQPAREYHPILNTTKQKTPNISIWGFRILTTFFR